MNWADVAHILTPIAMAGLTSFVAFVFLLPTKVGERLVAHHFEAKIAALKHEQATELGRLQAELDHLKDRGIRSNEREYQAITNVWERTVDAFTATKRCVVQFLEFPDLRQLSDDEVREFLLTESISGKSAEMIIAASDRNAAYSFNRRAHEVFLAGASVIDALTLLEKQSVFVPEALATMFIDMLTDLNGARIEQHMNLRSRESGERIKPEKSMELLGAKGAQAFKELRDAVRARLLHALQSDSTSQVTRERQKEGASD